MRKPACCVDVSSHEISMPDVEDGMEATTSAGVPSYQRPDAQRVMVKSSSTVASVHGVSCVDFS